MPLDACPAADELAQFAVGKLSPEGFERIAPHVDACPQCQAALEALERHGDPLLRKLAELGAPSSPHDMAEPSAELLASARRALAGLGSVRSTAAHSSRDDREPMLLLASGERRKIGRFELIRKLGVGSFGYVFLAHDTALDRPVAIKLQRAGRMANEDDVNRFLREARSTAQLKHPSIVSLYETGQTDDGVCFLVTEFVDGTTLEETIRHGGLTLPQAIELAIRLADALQYAHEQGVIHRDVKPSNIMLDREGRPHVMDFGLAKRETGEATMTRDGQVMGTPAYMSPEQARGESHEVDARSDVYSLGVVLYELLTGERPFQGNRRMLMLQVLEEEPRPPRRLNDKIPRDVETICLKTLAKNPARRYATAGELADDLRRFQAGEPIRARPVGYLERLWRWRRRNPVAAGLLLAVTIGSTSGLWFLSNLSRFLIQQSALDSARMQAEMLEEVNTFYSEIVDRLDPSLTLVTHEYATLPQAIPLPATFTIEAGARISQKSSGMQVRLYSDYPFPWRQGGGPQDAFESEALAALRRDPSQAVHEFTEIDGRPVMRFAKARVMKASCITCHNHHPSSPKKDWQAGDVRGVLEIIRPLDRDIARTEEGLRDTFLLLGVVSAGLLGGSLAILALERRRRLGAAVLPSESTRD